MPYASVRDLPVAFKNLPSGAKAIALETMNAVLEDKEETPELITQAVQAAWSNIKRKYRKEGEEWLQKSALHDLATRFMRWLKGNPDTEGKRIKVTSEGGVLRISMADMPTAEGAVGDPPAEEVPAEEPPVEVAQSITKQIPITKVDLERRLVYGIVLEPGDPEHVDAQGDWLKPEEIEQSCHNFMKRYRAQETKMRLQHEQDAPKVSMVECYIAPADFVLGEQAVKQGSWIVASHIDDNQLWEQVKSNELTGYSIGGVGEREN